MKNLIILNIDWFEFLLTKLKENSFNIIFTICVIIVSYFSIKFSNKAILKYFEKISKTDSKSCKIAKKSAKIGIIVTATFLILSKFNIPVNAFFTVFSSSLVAVGLALQEFFGNIAKSLQIRATAPFEVGDLIEIDSKKGRVKKIDYMHTYITNEENGLVMVPNSLIANKSIINYSKHEKKNKDNNIV